MTGLPGMTALRKPGLFLWAVLICCVVIGELLPAGYPFMVEFGDVLANGAGVSCGALLGLPFRTLFALI